MLSFVIDKDPDCCAYAFVPSWMDNTSWTALEDPILTSTTDFIELNKLEFKVNIVDIPILLVDIPV